MLQKKKHCYSENGKMNNHLQLYANLDLMRRAFYTFTQLGKCNGQIIKMALSCLKTYTPL